MFQTALDVMSEPASEGLALLIIHPSKLLLKTWRNVNREISMLILLTFCPCLCGFKGCSCH